MTGEVNGKSVLIVEDDLTLLRALSDNFEHEGFVVYTADDGEKGLASARKLKPDLLILDIMLPAINGYEVCRLIRRDGLDLPIIMLTAKGLETDVILGLNLGADDYVTKPFSIRELLARAHALLRRREGPKNEQRFGSFLLDLQSHRLMRDTGDGSYGEVALTPKEFAVLAMMAAKPGRAFTRNEILERIWGDSIFVTGRSVDRCINTLRKKIETDPREPVYIHTVREIGYRFEPPAEVEPLCTQ